MSATSRRSLHNHHLSTPISLVRGLRVTCLHRPSLILQVLALMGYHALQLLQTSLIRQPTLLPVITG
ncbi:hypothetical protein LINGRAHAP2_LOCUS20342, partial [Linum grandiflorum]